MLSTTRASSLVIALCLGACCHRPAGTLSTPIPLKDALGLLEKDLREVAPMSLSDARDVGGRASRIVSAIGLEQCRQDNANPLMPIASSAITVQLQGQIQLGAQAGFTISATPSLTSQGTMTQQQQQQFSVSVTFVSVAGLANYYFSQSVLAFASLPDDMKRERVKELLDERDQIGSMMKQLIAGYESTLKPHCADVIDGKEDAGVILFPLTPP